MKNNKDKQTLIQLIEYAEYDVIVCIDELSKAKMKLKELKEIQKAQINLNENNG